MKLNFFIFSQHHPLVFTNIGLFSKLASNPDSIFIYILEGEGGGGGGEDLTYL